MKRVILVAGIIGSMYFLSCESNAPVAMPMPSAGTPQISREEIEKVLDSEDFKQLSKVMGIPIETMSQEDKKALIDETQQFAQQMEQLPPQEQEKVMQDIFSQVEQQAQKPAPEEPLQPKVPEKKVTTPEKPKVSHHKIESSKKITQKLASILEKIELKFNSMLRASPDSTLEQAWAKVTSDLPWTISAMHRMSNNEKVLERLASSEFSVLNGQISTLYKQLKPLNKEFKTPDTSKLKQVTGTDASRAQVVDDQEKALSKKAAASIIKLLSGETSSIQFGIKGMLERYDKDLLQAIEKEAKQKQPIKTPETKGGMYKADGTRGTSPSGYTPSYYDRSSGNYQPSYGQDYGNYPSDSARSGSSGQRDGKGGYSAPASDDDKKAATQEGKDGEKAGTKGADGKEDQAAAGAKSTDHFSAFTKKIQEIEKKSTEFLTKHTALVNRLEAATADDQPAIREAQNDLGEIRFALIQAQGDAHRFLSAASQVASEEKAKKDLQAKIKTLTDTQRLVTLAQTVEHKTVAAGSQADQLKKIFGDFTQAYEGLMDEVGTAADKDTRQLQVQINALTSDVPQALINELTGPAAARTATFDANFDKALTDLEKVVEIAQKLKTPKATIIAGQPGAFITALGTQVNIPANPPALAGRVKAVLAKIDSL